MDYLKLKKDMEEDPYYQNFLADEEISAVHQRLSQKYLERALLKTLPPADNLRIQTALLVKQLSLRGSCRWLAEAAFTPDDNRYGGQMDGRDLKRWAALVLGDLFSGTLPDNEDFWHEY